MENANTKKIVLTANVARKASINLSTGEIKTAGSAESTMTIPSRVNDEWRTIVVPQTVAAGTTLFSITIGGVPYKFTKNEALTYVAGKMMNFGIKVDKQAGSGTYKLTLVSESITPWENDLVSHDATAREYIVINSTAGHLKEAIAAANKDYTKIKNLKITGEIDAHDFYFMRDYMSSLSAVNLKEVRIKEGFETEGGLPIWGRDDELPSYCFLEKKILTRIVFPDSLKRINDNALSSSGLSGSLQIPEGVEEIQYQAFSDCPNLNGTLTLPSTLKEIGKSVFSGDSFTGELKLPEGLEEIGDGCFDGFFYGELKLPSHLKKLGAGAFGGCSNLTGDLVIPQTITEIPTGAFSGCGFDGNLQLHNGIITIGERAFSGCSFRGELILPKDLQTLSQECFYGNDFSGELKLPKNVANIGRKAFAYNRRLTGTLEIPEDVANIGAGAFAQCSSLEKIILPSNLEIIAYENHEGGAFEDCFGINSIVCKGTMPPDIQSGAFNGVAKDNFTVEVPESAVSLYQSAPGWCEFKRIAAHHELVCRPSVASALSTEHKQKLVRNSASPQPRRTAIPSPVGK